MSSQDVHYGGGLVDGARIMQLVGDACTEVCIRHDGDEGLLRAYRDIEFLSPVSSGDYLEVRGELTEVGRTSRQIKLTVHKVIMGEPEVGESAAHVIEPSVLVCTATATCVVPAQRQRRAAPADQ